MVEFSLKQYILEKFVATILHFRGSEFSSYETELRKMTSHFELLTQKFFIEILFLSY